MIAKMVIRITDVYIECNSVKQYFLLKYEIDNILIAIIGIGTVTIIQAPNSHGLSKMYTISYKTIRKARYDIYHLIEIIIVYAVVLPTFK